MAPRLGLVLLALALPAASAANDWPQFRNDATHQGAVSAAENAEFEPFISNWWGNQSIPGPAGSPSVYRNVVYIGDGQGKLYAKDQTTGKLVWSNLTIKNAKISAAPSVGPENVFVVTESGKVYAFDRSTGRAVPGFPLPVASTSGSTLLHEDILYGGGADGVVWSYFASTQELRWKFDAKAKQTMGNESITCGTGRIDATPAVFEDWVYVGSTNYCFFAIKKSPGTTGGSSTAVWAYRATEAIRSSPAIDQVGRRVIFADANGHVFAIPVTSTGVVTVPEWEYIEPTVTGVSSEFKASPAIAGDLVIVAARNGNVRALDVGTGAAVWVTKLGGNVSSSPAVANGHVLIGSSDGKMYMLAASDGTIEGSWQSAAAIESSPAISGSQGFWSTRGGHVYSWGGLRLGQPDLTGGSIQAPGLVMAKEGTIKVTVRNLGSVSSYASHARLSVGDTEIETFAIPEIEAGGTANAEVKWKAILDGDFVLKLAVDSANEVDESDETNNVLSVTIKVAAGSAEATGNATKGGGKRLGIPGFELPALALSLAAIAIVARRRT